MAIHANFGHSGWPQRFGGWSLVDPVDVADAKRSGLEPCPRCDRRKIFPLFFEDPFALACSNCGWVGPREAMGDDVDTAVRAWNREARKVQEARKLGLKLNLDEVEAEQ